MFIETLNWLVYKIMAEKILENNLWYNLYLLSNLYEILRLSSITLKVIAKVLQFLREHRQIKYSNRYCDMKTTFD